MRYLEDWVNLQKNQKSKYSQEITSVEFLFLKHWAPHFIAYAWQWPRTRLIHQQHASSEMFLLLKKNSPWWRGISQNWQLAAWFPFKFNHRMRHSNSPTGFLVPFSGGSLNVNISQPSFHLSFAWWGRFPRLPVPFFGDYSYEKSPLVTITIAIVRTYYRNLLIQEFQ